MDENSHLMGALGIAIMSKNKNKNGNKLDFDFDIKEINFKTIGRDCKGCSNNCEIISIYKDNKLLDTMGGRCQRGGINTSLKVN